MGLWAFENNKAVRIKEYYYDNRREGKQKTDEEYYTALEKLADGFNIQHVIVDPSAASFIATIRNHGKFSGRYFAPPAYCNCIKIVTSGIR